MKTLFYMALRSGIAGAAIILIFLHLTELGKSDDELGIKQVSNVEKSRLPWSLLDRCVINEVSFQDENGKDVLNFLERKANEYFHAQEFVHPTWSMRLQIQQSSENSKINYSGKNVKVMDCLNEVSSLLTFDIYFKQNLDK